MSRLFITQREINFISDITKELIKDVVGQKIYYYRVRDDLTKIEELYGESIEKIFDYPIEIESRVLYKPQEIKSTKFGIEDNRTIEVDIQYRDMIDKDIEIRMGDFFSYDSSYFEIVSVTTSKVTYGQIEHIVGFKLIGKQARKGIISFYPEGPFDEKYSDKNAVQKIFVQQRGKEENELGKTNDKRSLIDSGKIESIVEKPVKVSTTENEEESSFYGE